MDDNARPHRAGVVDTFLQNHAIARMNWPARSPDLNSIEHVWDNLGRRISSLQPPPRNTHELETALTQEWALIPQELINSLILRCKHMDNKWCIVKLLKDITQERGRSRAVRYRFACRTSSQSDTSLPLDTRGIQRGTKKGRWSVLSLTATLVAAALVPPCLRGFMQDAELSSVNPQLSPGPGAT
ncbi:hypothetical protein LAZ67_8000671 [Cordylochernes scorpioides]|uniref:Tc1-like transposase DDE domain-containing protein n=1 Tax=Cordylochernes scorpioides TaxID=51811 RepID=A0ABY6KST4_9ARAC|nr:hypothetical protein LAZ67_8000671 [Cordylochernes scorpioides]